MKMLLPTGIALALLLGLGLAQTPAPAGAQDDGARIEALEAQVAALQADLAAQAKLVEETTRYLAGAKARSEALLQTFDAAEDAGFTAGINFHSREILLAGMRSYVRGEAQDLPGAPRPPAPAK
jgi:hypothetical protein